MEQNSQQLNASETHKEQSNSENQLIEYHEIEGTPFTVSKWQEEWYVLLGHYRLTTGYQTREIAEAEVKEITWFKIMGVVQAMIDENQRQLQKLHDTIMQQAQDEMQTKIEFEKQHKEHKTI